MEGGWDSYGLKGDSVIVLVARSQAVGLNGHRYFGAHEGAVKAHVGFSQIAAQQGEQIAVITRSGRKRAYDDARG